MVMRTTSTTIVILNVISETQRRAYLRAMDIDVWEANDQPSAAAPVSKSVVKEIVMPATTKPEPAVLPSSNATPAAADGARRWALLQNAVMRCTKCRLHETRTQAVFGAGDRYAKLMIIGESPGSEEDRVGEPFAGSHGKMLDAMLAAIGFKREQIYVANVLKCRTPQNRDPRVDELDACRDHLKQQIDGVSPTVILAVGRLAAQQLLQQDKPLGKLRGTLHQLPNSECTVVVTYHPAYLQREPMAKAKVWEDLKYVSRLLSGAA